MNAAMCRQLAATRITSRHAARSNEPGSFRVVTSSKVQLGLILILVTTKPARQPAKNALLVLHQSNAHLRRAVLGHRTSPKLSRFRARLPRLGPQRQRNRPDVYSDARPASCSLNCFGSTGGAETTCKTDAKRGWTLVTMKDVYSPVHLCQILSTRGRSSVRFPSDRPAGPECQVSKLELQFGWSLRGRSIATHRLR
jgi:hypothetical protein